MGALDFSYDLADGEAAVMAIRYPSGALTFHMPVESTRRGAGKTGEVRFSVNIRSTDVETGRRGVISQAVKAVLVKVGKVVVDKAVSFVLPKLAAAFESSAWSKKGLKEGWLKVTRDSLAKGTLASGTPSSTHRSLLFIHGTFSNAASAYGSLASSDFFDRVAPLYGDRMFAFNHFTISRTPEENARMLLEGLLDQTFNFDVITHSRGGLVLRNLVERASAFGPLARRFKLGRAVLVASPNDGTPLATPTRWQDTVGWIANLLELFPDNPFTTGAEFVANALVWLARHASGDLPGLHAMDESGDLIVKLQALPGPPPDAYSALVSNFNPSGNVLQRMVEHWGRSVFRLGERSGGTVGGRLASGSLRRDVHPWGANRLLRGGRQSDAHHRHARQFLFAAGNGRFSGDRSFGPTAPVAAGGPIEGSSRPPAAALGRSSADAPRPRHACASPRPGDRARGSDGDWKRPRDGGWSRCCGLRHVPSSGAATLGKRQAPLPDPGTLWIGVCAGRLLPGRDEQQRWQTLADHYRYKQDSKELY